MTRSRSNAQGFLAALTDAVVGKASSTASSTAAVEAAEATTNLGQLEAVEFESVLVWSIPARLWHPVRQFLGPGDCVLLTARSPTASKTASIEQVACLPVGPTYISNKSINNSNKGSKDAAGVVTAQQHEYPFGQATSTINRICSELRVNHSLDHSADDTSGATLEPLTKDDARFYISIVAANQRITAGLNLQYIAAYAVDALSTFQPALSNEMDEDEEYVKPVRVCTGMLMAVSIPEADMGSLPAISTVSIKDVINLPPSPSFMAMDEEDVDADRPPTAQQLQLPQADVSIPATVYVEYDVQAAPDVTLDDTPLHRLTGSHSAAAPLQSLDPVTSGFIRIHAYWLHRNPTLQYLTQPATSPTDAHLTATVFSAYSPDRFQTKIPLPHNPVLTVAGNGGEKGSQIASTRHVLWQIHNELIMLLKWQGIVERCANEDVDIDGYSNGGDGGDISRGGRGRSWMVEEDQTTVLRNMAASTKIDRLIDDYVLQEQQPHRRSSSSSWSTRLNYSGNASGGASGSASSGDGTVGGGGMDWIPRMTFDITERMWLLCQDAVCEADISECIEAVAEALEAGKILPVISTTNTSGLAINIREYVTVCHKIMRMMNNGDGTDAEESNQMNGHGNGRGFSGSGGGNPAEGLGAHQEELAEQMSYWCDFPMACIVDIGRSKIRADLVHLLTTGSHLASSSTLAELTKFVDPMELSTTQMTVRLLQLYRICELVEMVRSSLPEFPVESMRLCVARLLKYFNEDPQQSDLSDIAAKLCTPLNSGDGFEDAIATVNAPLLVMVPLPRFTQETTAVLKAVMNNGDATGQMTMWEATGVRVSKSGSSCGFGKISVFKSEQCPLGPTPLSGKRDGADNGASYIIVKSTSMS
ncbi:hypothetical protein GQ42DRAFT_164063 [Ramicandelaber brevisporus]|nr:hypothetical protein GQ42DRAFT_164063 [Ramicandelaber brevisporus]